MDAIVSYSLVTVKVDRDLPDTYTIVVDHNADHFPRFYEFASLPEIFKNETFARDADSQPPEAGLPLFDEYDDLFYGGPDDLYTGPRFVENTEEFVLVFFDGFPRTVSSTVIPPTGSSLASTWGLQIPSSASSPRLTVGT